MHSIWWVKSNACTLDVSVNYIYVLDYYFNLLKISFYNDNSLTVIFYRALYECIAFQFNDSNK